MARRPRKTSAPLMRMSSFGATPRIRTDDLLITNQQVDRTLIPKATLLFRIQFRLAPCRLSDLLIADPPFLDLVNPAPRYRLEYPFFAFHLWYRPTSLASASDPPAATPP